MNNIERRDPQYRIPQLCEHDAGIMVLTPSQIAFRAMLAQLNDSAPWHCKARMNEQSYLSHALRGCYADQHNDETIAALCRAYVCDKLAKRVGILSPMPARIRLIHYCGRKPWELNRSDTWAREWYRVVQRTMRASPTPLYRSEVLDFLQKSM